MTRGEYNALLLSWFGMKVASQTDMLADDWFVL